MSRGLMSTLLMGLTLSSLGGGASYGMKKDRQPAPKRESRPPKNTRPKCPHCRSRKLSGDTCVACRKKVAQC